MTRQTTHNFTATYQEGIISAIDPINHRVRCTIPALDNLETAFLPFLSKNAGSNQHYCLPDIGELAILLLDARGEGGCVLGTIYNAKDQTPVQSNDIYMLKFKNGTEISHDRTTGNINIKTSGSVTVSASHTTINATHTVNGTTTINGNTTINGALSVTAAISSNASVSAPQVSAGGINLSSHRHTNVEPGNGKSGTPV